MLDEYGFSHHRAGAAGTGEPGHCRQLAHCSILASRDPRNKCSRILEFATPLLLSIQPAGQRGGQHPKEKHVNHGGMGVSMLLTAPAGRGVYRFCFPGAGRSATKKLAATGARSCSIGSFQRAKWKSRVREQRYLQRKKQCERLIG